MEAQVWYGVTELLCVRHEGQTPSSLVLSHSQEHLQDVSLIVTEQNYNSCQDEEFH